MWQQGQAAGTDHSAPGQRLSAERRFSAERPDHMPGSGRHRDPLRRGRLIALEMSSGVYSDAVDLDPTVTSESPESHEGRHDRVASGIEWYVYLLVGVLWARPDLALVLGDRAGAGANAEESRVD